MGISYQFASGGAVTVATGTTALPHSPVYYNGSSGVGSYLEAGSYGALTVDSVTMTTEMSVLVTNFTGAHAYQNGLYSVTNPGSSGAPYVLTRRTDANTAALLAGILVYVEQGATQNGFCYVLPLAASSIVLDNSSYPLVFDGNASQLYQVLSNPALATNLLAGSTAAPAGTPTAGTVYFVSPSPTGAFAGQANQIAYLLSGGSTWAFFTPQTGLTPQTGQKGFVPGFGPVQYLPSSYTPSFSWGRKDRADLRDWATSSNPLDLTGFHDSTAVWNAAIAAMIGGHEPLYLPAGTILLGSSTGIDPIGTNGGTDGYLTIEGMSVSHSATGLGTILLNGSITNDFIVVYGQSIKLKDITLAMAGSTVASSGIMLHCSGANDLELENISIFYGFSQLLLDSCQRMRIKQIYGSAPTSNSSNPPPYCARIQGAYNQGDIDGMRFYAVASGNLPSLVTDCLQIGSGVSSLWFKRLQLSHGRYNLAIGDDTGGAYSQFLRFYGPGLESAGVANLKLNTAYGCSFDDIYANISNGYGIHASSFMDGQAPCWINSGQCIGNALENVLIEGDPGLYFGSNFECTGNVSNGGFAQMRVSAPTPRFKVKSAHIGGGISALVDSGSTAPAGIQIDNMNWAVVDANVAVAITGTVAASETITLTLVPYSGTTLYPQYITQSSDALGGPTTLAASLVSAFNGMTSLTSLGFYFTSSGANLTIVVPTTSRWLTSWTTTGSETFAQSGGLTSGDTFQLTFTPQTGSAISIPPSAYTVGSTDTPASVALALANAGAANSTLASAGFTFPFGNVSATLAGTIRTGDTLYLYFASLSNQVTSVAYAVQGTDTNLTILAASLCSACSSNAVLTSYNFSFTPPVTGSTITIATSGRWIITQSTSVTAPGTETIALAGLSTPIPGTVQILSPTSPPWTISGATTGGHSSLNLSLSNPYFQIEGVDLRGNVTGIIDNSQASPNKTIRNNLGVTLVSTRPDRNRLVNGAFQIAQWGAPFAAVQSSGQYTLDRWYCKRFGSVSGASVYQEPGGYLGLPYLRLQHTFGDAQSNGIYLVQALETQDSLDLVGQQVILKFWARLGATYSNGTSVVSGIAYNSTASGNYVGPDQPPAGVVNDTTGWIRVGQTTSGLTTTGWTLVTQALTVPATAVQVAVSISFSPAAASYANDYIDIACVSLILQEDNGDDVQVRSFDADLALCQRWRRCSFPYGTAPAQNAGLPGALRYDMNTGASGTFSI
jgi:hypothetical protein